MKTGLDPSLVLPQVTSIGGGSGGPKSSGESLKPGEFDDLLSSKIAQNPDLESIGRPLKFSAHASQRLNDRQIELSSATMGKLNDAVDSAEKKGLNDTLLLTEDAALIVNVKNRTVVTAMDRASMSGNVFTNIDGAVLI